MGATVRLAAPLIGGQLTYMGMSFIDTVMAGNLSAVTLAAVAIGSSVWSALNMFLTGVLLAVPAFVSQYDGEGTTEARAKIAPLLRQALWVGLGLAMLAMLLAANLGPFLRVLRVEAEVIPFTVGYLRALTWGIPAVAGYLLLRFLSEGLGASRPTLYFGLLGLPVNALANYVLMYGAFGAPRLGAVGCGWATALVWWVQLAAMLVYIGRHQRYRNLGLFAGWDPPQWERIREILRIGLPIGITIFLEGSLFSVVAVIMGSLGAITMAGHQVALNFTALTFMVPLGISMATTVRVGNAVGRKDTEGISRAVMAGVVLAMCCQMVTATVMVTLPRAIAEIYTDDPGVVAVAVNLLFLAALFQLSDGLQVSAAGALRGLKDTRVPMLLTAIAYWVVGMPVGWTLAFPFDQGARGLWYGLIASLTVAATLLGTRLWRVVRRRAERWGQT